MLERWADLPDLGEVMLNEEMRLVTLDIINRTMFSSNVLPEFDKIGHSVDVGLQYTQNIARSLVRIPQSWPTPANRRFKAAKALLDDYLYGMIAERRAAAGKKGDLLMDARDEDTGQGMNDEQVRNEGASGCLSLFGIHPSPVVGLGHLAQFIQIVGVLLDIAAVLADVAVHIQEFMVVAQQPAIRDSDVDQRLAIIGTQAGIEGALAVGRVDLG